MNCRMGELRNKEVINMKDGGRIGFISDVEIDTCTAQLTAVIVYGRLRCFGLFGREPETVIPWRNITLIGDDTVLVEYQPPQVLPKESTVGKVLKKLGF